MLARIVQCLVLLREGEPEFVLSAGVVGRVARHCRHSDLLDKILRKPDIIYAKAGNIGEDVIRTFG